MAKVSIILPIYNVQNYLRECLESVVNQTLEDIEIICVNDGSKDHSLDIIREYEKKDHRIVVITGPNGGYGKAMNKGLVCASGEYIGIVEPDDYVSLDMFEELYKAASEYDLDMVKSDFYRFTRGVSGKEERKYEQIDGSGKRYGEVLNPSHDPSTIRFTMNTWTGIYRREMIEKYHIRHHETPGASFQDNGFFWQTFIRAERAMILNKPFYLNRRDNPNSSVQSREKVYCMNIEYDFIRGLLMEEREIWERFKYMYWWKKYFNYMFTLERIGEQYKREYLERMQQEYRRAMQKGELRQDEFTVMEWRQINALIHGAEGFYGTLRSTKVIQAIVPYIPKPVKKMILRVIHWRK